MTNYITHLGKETDRTGGILHQADQSGINDIDLLSIPKEATLLRNFLDRLDVQNKELVDPRDITLFDRYLASTRNYISNLEMPGFSSRDKIRGMISYYLHGTVLSVYLKQGPHYLVDSHGVRSVDTHTHIWTPGFYRIEPALADVVPLIAGQDVLDPFAGSGSFMNAFAALQIPRSIVCGDICYPGGRPIFPDSDLYYDPVSNRDQLEAVYAVLPARYHPHLSSIVKQYITHDAAKMEFPDKKFDWIVSDPPYGIRNQPGGSEYVYTMMSELKRVVKQGIIFIAPLRWGDFFKNRGEKVEALTREVVPGNMTYPSNYILIHK